MLDFLGIGGHGCGSTWLYRWLNKHSDIHMPTETKELHYWDYKFYYGTNSNYHKGLAWYLSQFEKDKVCGEITPAYSLLDLETIRQIKAINPNLKIIFIMRNPIERAWSHAKKQIENKRIEDVSDQYFINHFQGWNSFSRGDYESILRNWMACFPIIQMVIMRYELLQQNPNFILSMVCSSLGIDPNFYKDVPDDKIKEKIGASLNADIRESLIPYLAFLYNDKIDRLSELLYDDFSDWKRQ